jgi:hypothetical protein
MIARALNFVRMVNGALPTCRGVSRDVSILRSLMACKIDLYARNQMLEPTAQSSGIVGCGMLPRSTNPSISYKGQP